MVKVNGPLMSMDASGTLADAVTFSKWRGRNYVRERVIPSNPETGAQVGRRAMFRFLTQNWDAILVGDKATWQDLADQIVASKFNAYLKQNMEDWHNFLCPSMVTPTSRTLTASDNVLTAAAWEENRIKLSIAGAALEDGWGITIYAKLAGAVTPAVGNCIIAEFENTIAAHVLYWTPPTLGRWYFNSHTFSINGKKAAAGGPVDTGA